jgi:hypothetical protein
VKYRCERCAKDHDGFPDFHADRPADYWNVPEALRERDVFLSSDSCIIAKRFFFVRGLIELPILGTDEHLTFGVWVSLKEENFFKWQDHYEVAQRSHVGPFFGWLCTKLPVYPDTLHLKTMLHLRDDGVRPRIELERTEHPLARAQHDGISLQSALDLVHLLLQRDGD